LLTAAVVNPGGVCENSSDNLPRNARASIPPPDADGAHLMTIPLDRLAEILDIAEDGIVTVDSRHRVVLFNRGAAKIFGYEPPEVLGQSLNLLLPERYRPDHDRQVDEFARGPVISRPMGERRTILGRRKDGSEFPMETTISKLQSGDQVFLTAIIRDAEARKKYEDALVRLNHDLEERVRARTAELAERNLQLTQKTEENEMFVYSVSHDLRSPLVNLEGFSEELRLAVDDLEALLSDGRIPADLREKAGELFQGGVREPVGFVRTAVGRLARIIDALLRLSRAGRVVYQSQPLDVAGLARRVVDAMRRTADERKAAVVLHDLPPAYGDPVAVEQVFGNLVGNALNYLDPARPGRVEVGALPDGESPNGTRTYFVRDNGIGIPAAYQGKLFQVLQRLHPDKAPGEGIGLAIVRRVLERLGGTIRLESQAGEGTTFYFTLPARPRADARDGDRGATP
jgi:PAS domain S-box-containing protein